jgi:HK97 family phage major capsid protein
MSAYETTLLEERAQAVHAAREILNRVADEKRSITAEEQAAVDKAFAEVDAKGKIVEDIRTAERLDAEVRSAMESPESRPSTPAAEKSDEDLLRSVARGEIRGYEFRDVVKTATGAPVPTSFYGQVQTLLRDYSGPLSLGQIITTNSGESLQFPRTNAYSTGSVTTEGAAYGESDPTFQSFLTLTAYKESVLFQVSREMIEDSGVDLMGYLAMNIGQAIGYVVNSHLTTGTGTYQPTGVVTSAGSGVTGTVSATFAYDTIVDLYYSLDPAVRASSAFAFMASTGGIKRLRKLVDTTGQPLWQPAVVAGQPDMILGKRIVENVAMADLSGGAIPVIAGDWNSFLIRQVGGLRVETSDEFAFNADLRTFKASLRIDSGLPQSNHIKYLRCLP